MSATVRGAPGGGFAAAFGGTIGGALCGAIVALGAFRIFVESSLFSDDGRVEAWAIGSTLVCAVCAVLGCLGALRRGRYDAAPQTAGILLVVLLVIIGIAVWSSSSALQSSLYPYAAALALVAPLACRAAARKAAHQK